jgi:hypothetical protein
MDRDKVNLTPEQDKIDKRIAGLQQQNKRMLDEITEVGPVDTGHARVIKLIEFLVDEGILTVDQMLAEQLSWEEQLRPRLQEMLEQARQIKAEYTERMRQQRLREEAMARGEDRTPAGLIIPGKG